MLGCPLEKDTPQTLIFKPCFFMTANELRQKYLDFFKSKGHAIVPSASLLPENDPTTLFTGSGMQPMVPYLMGEKHPEGTRIADSQKSFRAEDIEEVGDNRHTTFFEMLGNWSLGDYFKKEQIPWMFEFITKELGLDPKRIYVTVFRGNEEIGIGRDDEAVGLWQEEFKKAGLEAPAVDMAEKDGMQGGKIFYYPEKENWWSRAGVPDNMPVGEPGGPDSEMFWDFGEGLGLHEKSQWKSEPCHVNCDCGRFFEIGNNVFMEFIKTDSGFEPLSQQNVDFGGGLERLLAAVDDDPDVFKTQLFAPIVKKIEEISGKKYGQAEKETASFRVIMDHLRAATMLMADGAMPSNKDQGYFTRRLIRRAVRFADALGISDKFCAAIAEVVIGEVFAQPYPELANHKDAIMAEMGNEEDKFRKTLKKGLIEFEKNWSPAVGVSPETTFILYSTYGFPVELTKELAQERGKKIDLKEVRKKIEEHQDLSRTASAGKFKGGLADAGEQATKYHTATHLLLAGLKKTLGDHVHQRGSNITDKRLRFDFSHSEKMTDEEKQEVEAFVNEAIKADVPMSFQEMTIEEAKKLGAEGVFESKYGEKVKVYTAGEGDKVYSQEICGGPHVERIGELGKFRIKKEESSSSGVRRIKGVLG